MNFFFGIKHKNFSSKIQIPLFKNNSKINSKLKVFSAKIKKNEWVIKKIENKNDNDFCIINEKSIDNEIFFFLATKDDLKNFNSKEIVNLNNFTSTSPAFRANLCVSLRDSYGFSSYQSEYPLKMIQKKGSILSSLYTLTNVDADQNILILRNIYKKPIKEKFNGYIIDINRKKILKKIELLTNQTNYVELSKNLITPENYFYTDRFLGIPLFLVRKKDDLSLEHTHPLHEYILDKKKYDLVSKIKKKFYEIII